jgi:hypothetical protein
MTKIEVKELIGNLKNDKELLGQISYEELEALKPIIKSINNSDKEKLISIIKQTESEVKSLFKNIENNYEIHVSYDEIIIRVKFHSDKYGSSRDIEFKSIYNDNNGWLNKAGQLIIDLSANTRFYTEKEYVETIEKINLVNSVIKNVGSFDEFKKTLSDISQKHVEKCKSENVYYDFINEILVDDLITSKKYLDCESTVKSNLIEGTIFVSKLTNFSGFVKIEKLNDKTVSIQNACQFFRDNFNWNERVKKDEFIQKMTSLLAQNSIEIKF